MLELRPAADCRFDEVSLGEVMLRLDPGSGRIHTSRQFRAWEGGGEYNVARGLRRCFGLRTAIVTALVDNPVGRLVEDLMLQGGVDLSHVQWRPFDGVGRETRNGLNFTEAGFGVRGAVGVSDRGHTAIAAMGPEAVDWDALFSQGVRWFHTGGIYAALSELSAATCVAAIEAAKRHGVIVSYDLNYRPSLWRAIGGQAAAQRVNQTIAPMVDVMLGNEEDFTACLGFTVDSELSGIATDAFATMVGHVAQTYPNLQVIATTLRDVISASRNHWSAIAWSSQTGIVSSSRRDLEVMDRVGGGDSFASGLIYALLSGMPLDEAVEWGSASGALAMTTPGDTIMATRAEVAKLVGGGGARVDR
ncbi:MAG: sugar kinase [Propionibacteriaceae bacterium]|jgi:2-dehydro-3-deoxygluconokinase|nr:sugar kinase [Propionibacteriaceae bacterium]